MAKWCKLKVKVLLLSKPLKLPHVLPVFSLFQIYPKLIKCTLTHKKGYTLMLLDEICEISKDDKVILVIHMKDNSFMVEFKLQKQSVLRPNW